MRINPAKPWANTRTVLRRTGAAAGWNPPEYTVSLAPDYTRRTGGRTFLDAAASSSLRFTSAAGGSAKR